MEPLLSRAWARKGPLLKAPRYTIEPIVNVFLEIFNGTGEQCFRLRNYLLYWSFFPAQLSQVMHRKAGCSVEARACQVRVRPISLMILVSLRPADLRYSGFASSNEQPQP
jgi:hypothetical protein